jgi:SWI/SNF-related matrix-associated actin-dependent regulator of chromatin subfamily A-like protein 1
VAEEDEDVDFEELLATIPDEHLTTLRRWTGTAKAGLVAEPVQQELESRDKIIVFGVFRNTLDLIAAALGADAKVINGSTPQSERQRLIDDFQTAVQPRVLIAQINIAGTSLTLTRASRVLFSEITFTPADIVQAVRRCHRIGQRSSVYASIVSLAGSIDDVIAGITLRKANDIANLEALVAGRA